MAKVTSNKISIDKFFDLIYRSENDKIQSMHPTILLRAIKAHNIDGDTACHLAAKTKNYALIHFLIKFDLSIILTQNLLGNSFIYYLLDNTAQIKKIINYVASTCKCIKDFNIASDLTLTAYFIEQNNFSFSKFLIKIMCIDNSTVNLFFQIINSKFATDDKQTLLQILLDKDYSIDTTKSNNISPLAYTIRNGDTALAKFLIENNIDINYLGPDNMTNPLVLAIEHHCESIVALLLEKGFNVRVGDKYMRTPAHYIFYPNCEIATEQKRDILKRVSNVNSADNNLDSILYLLTLNDQWILYKDVLAKRKLKIYKENRAHARPIDNVKDKNKKEFLNTVFKSYVRQLKSDRLWVDSMDTQISNLLRSNNDIDVHKKYIHDKILAGQSYPKSKKTTSKIIFLKPPKINSTLFSSSTHDYICYICYVLKKYPSVKIPMLAHSRSDMSLRALKERFKSESTAYSTIKGYIAHSPLLINHIIIWKNESINFFSPDLIEAIKNTLKLCPDANFIIIKLTILTDYGTNHANIIIYDTKQHLFERFDPYGSNNAYDSTSLDNFLKEYFETAFDGVTYELSCEQISLQAFSDENNFANKNRSDPKGFCVAWCIWYIETRVQNINANVDVRKLIAKTISRINRESNFIDYIRNYANILHIEKTVMLEHANIPKKYWYANTMPSNLFEIYLVYIRNIINNSITDH